MRVPLFASMKYARGHPMVPQELRHSGILAHAWLKQEEAQGRSRKLYFYSPMNGTDAIDCIVSRVFRELWPVPAKKIARVRELWAASIYESKAQIALYRKRNISDLIAAGCSRGRNDCNEQLLFDGGKQCWLLRRSIPIATAPRTPCSWCGRLIYAKPSWRVSRRIKNGYANTIHCNARDCRRMDWLQYTPQSRGGIDLTPRQRESLSVDAWGTQRALNYLQLIAKELKTNGRNTNCNVR